MIDPRAHIAEMRRDKYWIDETGRLKGKNLASVARFYSTCGGTIFKRMFILFSS